MPFATGWHANRRIYCTVYDVLYHSAHEGHQGHVDCQVYVIAMIITILEVTNVFDTVEEISCICELFLYVCWKGN